MCSVPPKYYVSSHYSGKGIYREEQYPVLESPDDCSRTDQDAGNPERGVAAVR